MQGGVWHRGAMNPKTGGGRVASSSSAGPQDTPALAPHIQRWRSDPSEGEAKVCQLFSLAALTWAPPANASRRAAFSGTAVRVGVLVSVCRMDEVAGKEIFCCDTVVG